MFGKKFTLLDTLMLISVANPMTRNQIMSSAEIAEDLLIQFQIIKSESNPCVSSYSWSWFNFFRRESSSQIISECALSFIFFILFFHSKRKDERCNIQSLQHFLGNLHSFLYSLDEIRLADIKIKRFQQAFQFIKLPENVHLLKISCE